MGSLELLNNWGIVTENPVYPDYHSTERRLETFLHAPLTPHTLAKELSSAGFIYDAGPNKALVCYYCAGFLSAEWDPGDDPWQKHREHFPYCPHLHLRDIGKRPDIDHSESLMKTDQGSHENDLRTSPVLGFGQLCSQPSDITPVQVAMKMGFEEKDINFILDTFIRANGSLDGLTSQTLIDMLLFAQRHTLSGQIFLHSLSPREVNCLLKAERLCRFCHTQQRSVVFFPCRHVFACCCCAFRDRCLCGKEVLRRCRVYQ